MVDVTYIDHVETGLSLLPSQWEDKPTIRALLASWLNPLNVTEQQALDVRDGFNINTAVGAQLDIIGQYFQEARAGRSDRDYRNAILSFIASSNGSGTPSQLIGLYQSLTETDSVRLWEHYPLSVALLSTSGTDADPFIYEYLDKAAAASIEFSALMFDKFDYAWIPNDSFSTIGNVVTDSLDNVTTETPENVVADVTIEDTNNGSMRSSFVDESIPDPELVGYGRGYGQYYGGANFLTSQFVDTVTRKNELTPSGGNGLIEWAELEEFDEQTRTTNKTKPIKQFSDTGLKVKQTMPRQFFNWLMATIDDWLFYLSLRSDINSIQLTVDPSKTSQDYTNLFGGVWASRGSQALTMTNTGQQELVYVFERIS